MIQIPLLAKNTRLPNAFTDVVYVTQDGRVPWEIKRLLRQKGLSFAAVPLDQLHALRSLGHLIGTLVLDVQGMDPHTDQQVARTIEAMESENIGVIVVTHRVNRPVKSFSLAPSRTSFSLIGSTKTISVDDLWARISMNLAHRKTGPGMICKPILNPQIGPAGAPNRLPDRLQSTAALVEELTEQMRLAGLVQRDFLPKELPNSDRIRWAAAFQPAEWVSGDIYNVVILDQDHVGLYVVDAVGHAMPAALLTVFVKQCISFRQSSSPFGLLEPAAILQNLNSRMCRERLSGYQFATCCCGILDTTAMTFTYARAGHPYPILLRPGLPPARLESRGSLLGVFEGAEFVQASVQLHPGDKLLLYTDGAEPLIGHLDDQAGWRFEQSFLELADLPVVELVDRLMSQAKESAAGQAQVDDTTLVAFELT